MGFSNSSNNVWAWVLGTVVLAATIYVLAYAGKKGVEAAA